MINLELFVKALQAEGVDRFAGVPDSLLKNFCAYVTDHCGAKHVIAANEGGAVGLAAGHYLATGKPACVYMQNSGQGNAWGTMVDDLFAHVNLKRLGNNPVEVRKESFANRRCAGNGSCELCRCGYSFHAAT